MRLQSVRTYRRNIWRVSWRFYQKVIILIKSISPQAKILLISPILLGDDVWKTEYDPEFSRESVIVSKKLKAVYKRILADEVRDYINSQYEGGVVPIFE